ncbi:MAG: HAD family phosphatase [Ruminococcaceae bacterium]|nr:HAD family phosphatase [Oscillospiraceae bacterium]
MKIKGAIFDFDGTLIDSLGFWEVLWKKLGMRYLNDVTFLPDADIEKKMRTLTLDGAMELLNSAYGFAKNGRELIDIANDLCRKFYEETVELKAGAYELLSALYDCGVRTCIASASSKEMLSVVIERFKLSKLLPKIISCADIGKGKEFPDVFIMAHEYLATPKEETWIFEDSATALETARRAGFKTVGVYDRHSLSQQEKVKENSTVYLGEGKDLFESVIYI